VAARADTLPAPARGRYHPYPYLHGAAMGQALADTFPAPARGRYHPYPYLHGAAMGQALAAADLAVCRAGASTLGELPYFGLPAVLVPYPYAWRYQRVNAEWLASRGAAVILEDARLKEELVPTVRSLLGDSARLSEMRERARALARPDAAQRLAQLLVEIGGMP